ncbi:MAG: hypothetical protein LBF72_03470 [Holosporales bacterium]|nr:hypothetical protein [Holosporales bacterium]
MWVRCRNVRILTYHKYAALLCSVSPSQNSDFEGFERGPLFYFYIINT